MVPQQIASARIYRYALPWKPNPFFTRTVAAEERCTARRGLILQVTYSDGSVYLGEAAPLPKVSAETVEDCLAALPPFLEKAIGKTAEEAALYYLTTESLPPSVRCAVSSVFAPVFLSAYGKTADTALENIHVNAWVTTWDEPGAAAQYVKDGRYNVCKVKMAVRPVADEVEWLKRFTLHLGAHTVRLRIDANRGWDIADARSVATVIRDLALRVDYIEEPLNEPQHLLTWSQETGIPFALDESAKPFLDRVVQSLRRGWIEEIRAARRLKITDAETPAVVKHAKAVVIKPTVIGALWELLRLNTLPSWNEKEIVISSTYESSIGLQALARLTAHIDKGEQYHGLGTSVVFDNDVIQPAPAPTEGRYPIYSWDELARRIAWDVLEEWRNV